MRKTVLAILSLGCIFSTGCTQQKVEKLESLREAYFQMAEKLVIKEEINSKYIKELLNGYKYEKGEEFKIEGGNLDGSDYIQQPYIFTDGDESLTITHSNYNSEEQLQPLYTLKDENGEINLAILLSDTEDSETSYMYTANRDNLKEHKVLLEKLNKDYGKWYDTYIKVIDNICSTNDLDIEDIKNFLGTEYTVNEYPYDVEPSLGLNIVEYSFENSDEMFMVQYLKENDMILNVFYNDKNINTINTVIDNKLINEKDKLYTGILTYVEGLDKQKELLD
ncbi:MAG: hypothetical protein ACRC92_03020 [Peptostreptococcaceae bacterium]